MPLVLPLADAGTPLMWAGAFHMCFGNFVIGVGEGTLLARVFRISWGRAVGCMVVANYFSMFMGAWFFGSEGAAHVGTWYLGEVPLNHVRGLLLLAFLGSWAASILLEWPFVLAAMWWRQQGFGQLIWKSLLGSLVAQVASYFVLGALYANVASLSLLHVPVVNWQGINRSQAAVVFFVDGSDHNVYRMTLDGKPRVKVGGPVAWDYSHNLEFITSEDGTSLDLCVTRNSEKEIIAPKVAALAQMPPDWQPGPKFYDGGPATDLRPEKERSWEVRTGYFPEEGLRARNVETGARYDVALATPFFKWASYHATVLPGDQVIYELQGQVVLLDLGTRQMGMVTMGESPVVMLGSWRNDRVMPQEVE